MNTSHFTRLAAVVGGAALVLGLAGTAVASPARADEVIATDTSVVSPAVEAHVPTAVANKPRQITVTNHGGRSVTLFAKGERIRRILAPGTKPAVFTGLTADDLTVTTRGAQTVLTWGVNDKLVIKGWVADLSAGDLPFDFL